MSNNNVNNNNNSQSVTQTGYELGNAIFNFGSAIWGGTGGKVVNYVKEGTKSLLSSNFSSNSDFSAPENVDILERRVEKIEIQSEEQPKTYGEIKQLILSEEVINDEKFLVINLESFFNVGKLNLENEMVLQLCKEIFLYKNIKMKYIGSSQLLFKKIKNISLLFEKYVELRKCHFPVIRELELGSVGSWELDYCAREQEKSDDYKDYAILRNTERLVIHELNWDVSSQSKFKYYKTVGKEMYFGREREKVEMTEASFLDIIFHAKLFTSLKEIKIFDLFYKNKSLKEAEKGTILPINFRYWLEQPCYGVSKVNKIFLPKEILKDFDIYPCFNYKGGSDSYICGLRGNGMYCDKNNRYWSTSHTYTCLFMEKNNATGTTKSSEVDRVEFIFE